MPNYDFHCARHGIFEAMSSAGNNGVESVVCPKCGELAPVIWRRSPSIRKPGIAAVRFGGHDIPEEVIEQRLAEKAPDEDAGFWDDSNFGADFSDALDRNIGRFHAGDLPPAITDEQMTTLQKGVAGE